MGESTCFMQPFSYASGLPSEQSEGNPIHALGQSISFGRFVTDSVSWDKWSVFPHNRYVEEAEKFSRPGSVAQKKAFFEAHYKEIAARKAAALLEQQANAASADAAKPSCKVALRSPACYEFPGEVSSSQTIQGESQEVQEDNNEVGSAIEGNGVIWNVKVKVKETGVIEEIKEVNIGKEDDGADLVTEAQVHANDYVAEEPLGRLEDVDNREKVIEIEQSGTPEMEKPLLTADEADLVIEALVHANDYVAEELSGQLEDVDNREEVIEIEQSGTPEMEKPLLKNSADQAVLVSTSKKKSAGFSLKSVVCLKASSNPSSPVKSTTAVLSWKDRCATPTSSKSTNRTRSTPKQLLPINLTPVRELKRTTPTFTGKTGSLRTGVNSCKPSKECQTPLKTPTMVHANRTLKHSLVTPQSANRRTPCDGSAVESLNTGPKRRSLARDCSKFLSACKNKLQSPSLSTPFRLRTEERAARRKKKLEEKFNADEKEKIQLQKTVKEKAESEMRKFRQSFCFKARPLPDFYKEKTMPPVDGHMKKPPGACPQTPKTGKKPTTTTTTAQSTSFLHQRPLFHSNVSKQVQGKNHRILFPQASQSTLLARENRSPNIQLG